MTLQTWLPPTSQSNKALIKSGKSLVEANREQRDAALANGNTVLADEFDESIQKLDIMLRKLYKGEGL